MKNMKKIFALVISVLLVMSMLTVAFADPTPHSITITNTNEHISINGKKYSAYKLFDSTHSGTAYAYTMSTSSQFYDAKLVSGTDVASGSLVELLRTYFTFTANTSDSSKINVVPKSGFDSNVRTFADAIQPFLSSKTADATSPAAANETATITLPSDDAGNGYYIVTGSASPTDGATTHDVVSAVILTNEDPTAAINPKADAPQLDKKITGEFKLDDAGNAATAEVGKIVSFELDSNVPDLTGYTTYTYTIHDTMSSGLDFLTGTTATSVQGLVLKINDETIATTGYTVVVSGRSFDLTIPKATLETYNKGDSIVVTYSAKVNASALNTNYEKNTANLEYSNNPYDSSEHDTTPDDTVYVIDINIDVDKYAGSDTGSPLAGASFLLFKGTTQPADADLAWYHYNTTTNEVEWVARASADTFTTGSTGHFDPNQVRGLKAESTGTTYGLLETAAPTGYNLLTAPIIITLTGSYTPGTETTTASCSIEATQGTVTGGEIDLSQTPAAQPVDEIPVSNESGQQLPSTGGIGTTLFYVGGGILVLAAVILLVTKKRMSAND